MTSSPSSTSARIVKNMIGLPPGTTTTCSGPPVDRRASRMTYSAITWRNSGRRLRRAVVRLALASASMPASTDVRRGVEVGFADLQVDHAAALRLERLGAHQHLERAFGSKAAHAFRQCDPTRWTRTRHTGPLPSTSLAASGCALAGTDAHTRTSRLEHVNRPEYRPQSDSREGLHAS